MWNVIPPPAENLLLDRFSNGNGHNPALVREPQTKQKRVSYSLGEAHLSGGVRACGKVVLKGKQGL